MAHKAIAVSFRHCQVLAFRPDRIVLSELDSLLALAEELRLPVEMCTKGLVDTDTLSSLTRAIGSPSTEKPRTCLLICGAYLEEQISFSAQYMLATGFEVYLLRELIVPKNPEHAQIHDRRLLQSGAVATTVQQLVYEWTASETDQISRNILLKFSAG